MKLEIDSMKSGVIAIIKTQGRQVRYLVSCEPRTEERAREIFADFENATSLREIADKYDAQIDLG